MKHLLLHPQNCLSSSQRCIFMCLRLPLTDHRRALMHKDGELTQRDKDNAKVKGKHGIAASSSLCLDILSVMWPEFNCLVIIILMPLRFVLPSTYCFQLSITSRHKGRDCEHWRALAGILPWRQLSCICAIPEIHDFIFCVLILDMNNLHVNKVDSYQSIKLGEQNRYPSSRTPDDSLTCLENPKICSIIVGQSYIALVKWVLQKTADQTPMRWHICNNWECWTSSTRLGWSSHLDGGTYWIIACMHA